MKVRIPTPLRSYTEQRAEVDADGSTLAELLLDLDRRHPGIRFRMVDEQGKLRKHMKIFLNGEAERDLSLSLAPADEVIIMQALSGGSDEDDDAVSGEVPEGVGPEVFRERLSRAKEHGSEHGAHMRLHDQDLYLEDIESIEEDEEGRGSRVTLRNGLIIGGITGAAIVAALATVRYRRRRRQ